MAQQIVLDLLSSSEAVKNTALAKSHELDEAEATAISEEFAQRIRTEENRETRTQLLSTLTRFVGKRPERQSDFVVFCREFSTSMLSPAIIPILQEMSNSLSDTGSEQAILTSWVKDENTDAVTKIAKDRLSKIRTS